MRLLTITVENTGNTTLTGLSLADTFKDGNQNDLIFDHGDGTQSINPQMEGQVKAHCLLKSQPIQLFYNYPS